MIEFVKNVVKYSMLSISKLMTVIRIVLILISSVGTVTMNFGENGITCLKCSMLTVNSQELQLTMH